MAIPAKRLLKEWKQIANGVNSTSGSAPEGDKGTMADVVDLRPSDGTGENLLEWSALLRGPATGNYAGGLFEVSITVPTTYPQKPPKMNFRTRIWHPNVSWKTGEICLDVLQSQWTPAWTLQSLCLAVLVLLDEPEPDSPLNVDAANVFRAQDPVAYRSACQMYTLLYAADDQP